MGRWGASAFVPSTQFTKDEMWSQAAKVGPGCPNSSGAPLPWWPACRLWVFRHTVPCAWELEGLEAGRGGVGECPTDAKALITPQLCLTAVSTWAAWCPGCCLYCSWMPTLCYSAKESQPRSRGVPSCPTNWQEVPPWGSLGDRGLLEIFLGSLPQTRRCSRFLMGPGPGRARRPHAHGSSAATARSPHPTGHMCRHRSPSGSAAGKDRKGVIRASGKPSRCLQFHREEKAPHTYTHTHPCWIWTLAQNSFSSTEKDSPFLTPLLSWAVYIPVLLQRMKSGGLPAVPACLTRRKHSVNTCWTEPPAGSTGSQAYHWASQTLACTPHPEAPWATEWCGHTRTGPRPLLCANHVQALH